MPAKKKAEAPVDEPDPHTIPVPTEESDAVDEIKITFQVVANIVKMSTMEVDGVYSVKDGSDGIWETFGGRKSEKGVEVIEDEAGEYVIKIHVELLFGVKLAETAKIIQQHVRDQVETMTGKSVSKVDVYIDGVREVAAKVEEKDSWNPPHTD
ncbi:Asp23/Gls24 family envelope stress response protein [Cerasicoccus fimbriatus]|uniref:Asp23/Gls24 family envelope stress response protein n=1 Tax=Cerasicoccus fimbriatus TaxID=3014554 RepID=UPI0022B5DE88|nr:Asp23/Gls24 family envelope stress response protein [Cerasicoccus sp. TK19100]